MSKVLLYVYDLSNGMARALSLPLTGKQIDGIWHTSVVAYGREVFYGAGVMETLPGRSHHGQPLQVIDCGKTEVPEDLFNDYITDMKEEYTASRYHLLTFNCNSFTQDVIGFLTGGSIPVWISSLPSEFLSTPFGQQFKPRIDAMYTQGHVASSPSNDLPSSLLSSVTAQASRPVPTSNGHHAPLNTDTDTDKADPGSSLLMVTNPASLRSALETHPWSIAMLISRSGRKTPHPLEAQFEAFARDESNEAKLKVEYIVVDVDIGKGKQVAHEIKVDVAMLPAFVFFKDGDKDQVLQNLEDEDELEAAVIWHLAQAQEVA